MNCAKMAEPIDLPFGFVDSGGPEGSTSSVVFAMGGHVGATWRIRFHRPFAAAMRPYVKLL